MGTGTTFAGLRNRLPLHQNMLGFIPIKGGKYLDAEIRNWMDAEANTHWQTFDEWHFGGFGKYNNELVDFLNDFYLHNTIPLDFVYEGKMMRGVQQLLHAGFFSKEARILCLHCGGLQGNASISHKLTFPAHY
jgi:1-aminocyclopropane-1-carboxylate deaminase